MKVAPLGPPLGSDQVKYLICHDLRSINTCFQALNPLLGCQNGDHKNTLIHVVNKFSWQILFPLKGRIKSWLCTFAIIPFQTFNEVGKSGSPGEYRPAGFP